MTWTLLPFGKRYKGKTLPQVVLHDPDWFFWAWESGAIKRDAPGLVDQARVIARGARAIKIPRVRGERGVAAFYCDPFRGGVAVFDIVPASYVLDDGATRVPVIDLSLPRQLKKYDKAGGRVMIEAVRDAFFGGGRLTRKRCEAFFDDPNNFTMAPKKVARSVRWKVTLKAKKSPGATTRRGASRRST